MTVASNTCRCRSTNRSPGYSPFPLEGLKHTYYTQLRTFSTTCPLHDVCVINYAPLRRAKMAILLRWRRGVLKGAVWMVWCCAVRFVLYGVLGGLPNFKLSLVPLSGPLVVRLCAFERFSYGGRIHSSMAQRHEYHILVFTTSVNLSPGR